MSGPADVVVVGAGLIGSSIAWRLAQGGRRVVLVDRGEPGAEASSAAGGALIPEAGTTGWPGPALLKLYLASLGRYAGFVDEVRAATGAAFEYRAPGRLYLAFDDAAAEALVARVPVETAAGVRVKWATSADVRELEPGVTAAARGALYFVDDAFVDNARLSAATAQAAARAGTTVRAHEEVLSLALAGGRVVGVESATGRLSADAVVLAAGCWSSRLAPWRAGMLRPAKGEMISLDLAPRPIERMVGMVGATIVPRADGRMMIGATRTDGDHSRHVTAAAVARMLAAASTLVPALAAARFGAAWSGLRPLTPDRLPVIGPDGDIEGLYWATGHLGMGILSAPTTADCVSALLAGQAPPVPIDAFAPGRFPAKTLQVAAS